MRVLFLRVAKLLLVGAVCLAAVAASNQPAPLNKKPAKASISDFAVDVEEHQVLVAFKLEGAFDDNLKRRLESGLATGLVFDFELVRKRKIWFNKTVARGKLQVSAMYNAVSREYLVNYKHDGTLIDSRLVRDPEELRLAMSEFEKISALSVEGKKGEFVFRMRAELGTGSLLFFIPTLRTTEWVEERVRVDQNGRLEPEEEVDGPAR